MGGCYSSDLNKPPPVRRPAQRLKQSDVVVLTELSDLDDDDFVLKEPQEITYKGRGTNSVGIMPPTHKQKIEKELKKIQRETNKEVKRKQEIQLEEKVRQQKHNFTLQKEQESKFRLEQEKFQAKQQEMLQAEMKRRKEIFKTDDNTASVAKVEKEEDTWSSNKKTRKLDEVKEDNDGNNNEGSRVYRPQQFNLTGITNSGWGLEVQDLEGEDPEPKPPTYRKKDIVPNLNEFNLFDKHAVKAPASARSSVSTLVNYLKTGAENHFQLVRMFYRWITFNISFDVEGYFGEEKLQSVEAEDVLQAGITIAEGYANLMEAMCRYEGIPVKVIHGLVKGYNYQVGDIINFTESRIMHSWNAVYINRNWFFIDCAWGAGRVDKERKWHRQFQEFYFIVDPDKMIVDHFPFMDEDLRASAKWQLLPSPVSANSFNQRLKMERAALEWEVKPVSHTQHHIITVRKEIVVQLEEVASILEDYTVQFQRKDGSRNLDKFFFACKLNERILRIEIRPPEEVDYLLNIYAQKSIDAAGKSELLVTYILKCVEVLPTLRQFPTNFRIFGAVPDYAKYGFCSDITKCCEYTCSSGEMILPLKTKRSVVCMTKLEHIDEHKDLTNYCLITAKDRGISIKMRFPFEGYYKFTLFGKQDADSGSRPVATFLIDCDQSSHVHSGFPVAFEAALELKCTLYKPLWKDLPSNSTIVIVMGCPNIAKASVMYQELEKDENNIFEKTVTTPPAGQPFTIYGQKTAGGPLLGLYHFTIF